MDILALTLLAQSWGSYHGGPENTKYSTLDQISPANVAKLRIAWQYDSGDEFENSEIQCNPIVIEGILYATTPKLRLVALDAGTGKPIWTYAPGVAGEAPRKRRNRGVTFWKGQILYGYDSWLLRVDAKTGKEIGRIDLREGLGRDPKTLSVANTTPGVIFQDMLILGHLTSEDLPAAPGDIRAFDLKTGKIVWTFHTIPHPGEFGADTWPEGASQTFGGANNWSGMALDEKRGIVFVPTGSGAFDFYGANRPGDNLFANSLLALDARTGKRLWHFQFVKHDVWDRDLPTAPTLVQVRREGKLVDAVAQITKSGHVFLFSRVTGESLFPLKEQTVPPSTVDGESLAKTQWLPTLPGPFARQRFTAEIVRPELRSQLAGLDYGDQFVPPGFRGTVIFPGFDGGGEWGGATFDPTTHVLYVNANEMAWILRLVERPKTRGVATPKEIYRSQCAGCHRPDRKGTPPEFPALLNLKRPPEEIAKLIAQGAGRMPGFSQLGDDAVKAMSSWLVGGPDVAVRVKGEAGTLKYSTDGYNKFLDSNKLPGIVPPWGTLSAIDLDRGKFLWQQPLGEYPQLEDKTTGSENYGGSIVTRNGLLFIAATIFDKKIRAFDKTTGKLLWEHSLPASGSATPALYQHKGKEYLVIAAGGGKSGAASGGSYVAFALP